MEGLNVQEKIIPVEGETGKENGEREVARMFGPLTEGMLSEVGTERVNDEPNFRNISESFK